MELAITKAKARLSELVTAAQNGERVVITKRGEPAVELVGCAERRKAGFEWDKWEATRRRLGIKDAPPEEAKAMRDAFHDAALSRRVLGLEDD